MTFLHLGIRKNYRVANTFRLVIQPADQLDLFGGRKSSTDVCAHRHQAVIGQQAGVVISNGLENVL